VSCDPTVFLNPSKTFVSSAGIARFGLFATSPFEYHEAVMNINFKGVINTIYDSLNLMKENRGALVFSTSSSSAMYGIPGLAIYSATKHGVFHFRSGWPLIVY
jgi:short-subunit dehydrogenase